MITDNSGGTSNQCTTNDSNTAFNLCIFKLMIKYRSFESFEDNADPIPLLLVEFAESNFIEL